jgi:hypothetical protein
MKTAPQNLPKIDTTSISISISISTPLTPPPDERQFRGRLSGFWLK